MNGGLLSPYTHRKCPSCGTALQKQDGDWAMHQIVKRQEQWDMVHTGVLFTCLIYRCPHCRHLELVDSE